MQTTKQYNNKEYYFVYYKKCSLLKVQFNTYTHTHAHVRTAGNLSFVLCHHMYKFIWFLFKASHPKNVTVYVSNSGSLEIDFPRKVQKKMQMFERFGNLRRVL